MPKISSYPIIDHLTMTGNDYFLGDAAAGPTTSRALLSELMLATAGFQIAPTLSGAGTLVANKLNPVNTSGGSLGVSAFTLNLPSNAVRASGMPPLVVVEDLNGTFDTKYLTVHPNNGENVAGSSADYVCYIRNGVYFFMLDPANNWIVWSNGSNLAPPRVYSGAGASDTLVAADAYNAVLYNNSAQNMLALVPTNASVPFPIGTAIMLFNHRSSTFLTTVNAVTPATTKIYTNIAGVINTVGGRIGVSGYASQANLNATLKKTATDEWQLAGAVY